MATIDEVVKMWDEKHPEMQTEVLKTQKGTNYNKRYPNGKSGHIGKIERVPNVDKAKADHAFIKLSDKLDFKKAYYLFDFFHNGHPDSFIVKFQIEKVFFNGNEDKYNAFYKFLDTDFNRKGIKGINFILEKNSAIKLYTSISESSKADSFCETMEQLIELTKKKICDFLED